MVGDIGSFPPKKIKKQNLEYPRKDSKKLVVKILGEQFYFLILGIFGHLYKFFDNYFLVSWKFI